MSRRNVGFTWTGFQRLGSEIQQKGHEISLLAAEWGKSTPDETIFLAHQAAIAAGLVAMDSLMLEVKDKLQRIAKRPKQLTLKLQPDRRPEAAQSI